MTAEGIYTFTVTSPGYDGNTYSDKIAITVLDKAKLDALLKAKWEGMKTALIRSDISGALAYFLQSSQETYREIFSALMSELPAMAADMQDIQMIYANCKHAKYRIRRNETIKGTSIEITYYIYFLIDHNGDWRIDKF